MEVDPTAPSWHERWGRVARSPKNGCVWDALILAARRALLVERRQRPLSPVMVIDPTAPSWRERWQREPAVRMKKEEKRTGFISDLFFLRLYSYLGELLR